MSEVATILYNGSGVTGAAESSDDAPMQYLRASPSAGALYPCEAYLAVLRVRSLSAGIYHYDPYDHLLEKLSRGAEHASRIGESLLESLGVARDVNPPAIAVVLTSIFLRSRFKYGLRGYRFVLLEAGHIMQNMLLTAESLGLAATPVGGFIDCDLEDVLQVDGLNESVLYCAVMGRHS